LAEAFLWFSSVRNGLLDGFVGSPKREPILLAQELQDNELSLKFSDRPTVKHLRNHSTAAGVGSIGKQRNRGPNRLSLRKIAVIFVSSMMDF